ncbi:GreA/GreB family elongation factor [Azohydromonas caseinilytica]|uniref:Transcription elongation factor GreAB n=1 Tax=Azohydromonas caseinilytica TaxID=2728836 RepID=A0A848FFC3_9BURK|nr:GreA/GreB family elongation factor [Azohydromonas caseinilytica]NML16850.1 transcription elongation factor GreAB [Azohydromonas caseinilytica]
MSRPAGVREDERVLNELDHVRVLRWIRHTEPDSAPYAPLSEVLETALLVPSRRVPCDVVTMNSQVLLQRLSDHGCMTLTLCYPEDCGPGFVSVLTPLGSALLGQRVGALVRWWPPTGRAVQARVLALLFQPEACGDYSL